MNNRKSKLSNLVFNIGIGFAIIFLGLGVYKIDYPIAGALVLFVGVFFVAYPKVFKPFK